MNISLLYLIALSIGIIQSRSFAWYSKSLIHVFTDILGTQLTYESVPFEHLESADALLLPPELGLLSVSISCQQWNRQLPWVCCVSAVIGITMQFLLCPLVVQPTRALIPSSTTNHLSLRVQAKEDFCPYTDTIVVLAYLGQIKGWMTASRLLFVSYVCTLLSPHLYQLPSRWSPSC